MCRWHTHSTFQNIHDHIISTSEDLQCFHNGVLGSLSFLLLFSFACHPRYFSFIQFECKCLLLFFFIFPTMCLCVCVSLNVLLQYLLFSIWFILLNTIHPSCFTKIFSYVWTIVCCLHAVLYSLFIHLSFCTWAVSRF